MNPTFDNSNIGGSASTASAASFNLTVGKLRGSGLLIVGTTCQAIVANLKDVSSITINGVALTRIGLPITANNGGGYGSRSEIWYLSSPYIPSEGTYTITVTYSGSVEAIACGAMTFYNVRPQAPNVSATNFANGTNPLSVSITPTKNNCLIVAVYGSQNESTVTIGSGQTVGFDSRPGAALTCHGSYKVLVNAGATTMSAGFVNPESEEILASAFEAAPANAGSPLFFSGGGVGVT